MISLTIAKMNMLLIILFYNVTVFDIFGLDLHVSIQILKFMKYFVFFDVIMKWDLLTTQP